MLRFCQAAQRMAARSDSGTTIFPVPIPWDWDSLIKQRDQQRDLWRARLAEARFDRTESIG